MSFMAIATFLHSMEPLKSAGLVLKHFLAFDNVKKKVSFLIRKFLSFSSKLVRMVLSYRSVERFFARISLVLEHPTIIPVLSM